MVRQHLEQQQNTNQKKVNKDMALTQLEVLKVLLKAASKVAVYAEDAEQNGEETNFDIAFIVSTVSEIAAGLGAEALD